MKLTTSLLALALPVCSSAAALAQDPAPPAAPEAPAVPAEPAPPPPPAEPAPPPPPPPPAPPAPVAGPATPAPETAPSPGRETAHAPATSVAAKYGVTLYGFVELDTMHDSTQSLNDLAGNAAIARPGTYAGEHGRTTFGARNSRIGFKFKGPESEDVKTSAIVEMDFLGNQPPTSQQVSGGVSEAGFFQNPAFRIRHMAWKLETPIVDVLAGQYWQLFGWQSYFHPNTVDLQGVPGQVYSRAPQLRLSHVFKTDPVNVELAVAGARPPQRNSEIPDGHGGLKISINDWKGVHTAGGTGTAADAMAIGVSGVVREFKVDEFAAKPVNRKSKTGWGVSADGLIPVIPGSMDHRENSLTLTGSYVYGKGIADLYTGLTGGVGFPALPNPTMASPAPTYTPDIDNGLVTFDSNGNLRLVDWQSYIVGFQYYLPPSGSVWISANYSWMKSKHGAEGSTATSTSIFKESQWADGNLFWDINSAVRVGAEYAWFHQKYADNVKATNHRVQASFWYLF